MNAVAYALLSRLLIRHEGADSTLAQALGVDVKGLASMGLYAAAIGLAFAWPWVAQVLYAVVALMWIVPDRRIEKQVDAPKPVTKP